MCDGLARVAAPPFVPGGCPQEAPLHGVLAGGWVIAWWEWCGCGVGVAPLHRPSTMGTGPASECGETMVGTTGEGCVVGSQVGGGSRARPAPHRGYRVTPVRREWQNAGWVSGECGCGMGVSDPSASLGMT